MKTKLSLLVSIALLACCHRAHGMPTYNYYFTANNEACGSCTVDGQNGIVGHPIAIHNNSQVAIQYAFGCMPGTYGTVGYLDVYDETVIPRILVREVPVLMYYGVEWDQWNIWCIGDSTGYNVESEYAPCR